MTRTLEQRRALDLLERQIAEIKDPEKKAKRDKRKRAQKERRKAIDYTVEGQRKPRRHNEGYLNHVRLQSCILADIAEDCSGRTDPAHLRFSEAKYGRTNPGAGNKSDDKWVLPLCRHHHEAQHACGNERRWWSQWGIDPNAECETRFATYQAEKGFK